MTAPSSPITLAINGLMVDAAMRKIQREHFPEYEVQYTSAYRSPVVNAATRGSVKDSTHTYNLGRDLVFTKNGVVLSDPQMKIIHDTKFSPNWPDFSYFKPTQPGNETGHVHAHLNRSLSDTNFLLGLAGLGLGAGGIVWAVYKLRRTAK